MRAYSILLSSFFVLLSGTSSLDAAEDLTKEGKLKESFKASQLQGGFAGFTGTQYTIAPDGSWTSATVFNRKITPKAKGKLSAKELAKLTQALAKYKFAKLPPKSGKAPGANPHSITFEYGKQKAVLVGRVPPKLDPKNPTGTIPSRFAGIWQAVNDLLTSAQKK